MPDRLTELHEQRGRLLERIAYQRSTLARQFVPVQDALRIGDRATGALHQGRDFLLRNSTASSLLLLSLLLFRPRTAWRWGRRGFIAWRTWSGLRTLLSGIFARQFRNLL